MSDGRRIPLRYKFVMYFDGLSYEEIYKLDSDRLLKSKIVFWILTLPLYIYAAIYVGGYGLIPVFIFFSILGTMACWRTLFDKEGNRYMAFNAKCIRCGDHNHRANTCNAKAPRFWWKEQWKESKNMQTFDERHFPNGRKAAMKKLREREQKKQEAAKRWEKYQSEIEELKREVGDSKTLATWEQIQDVINSKNK